MSLVNNSDTNGFSFLSKPINKKNVALSLEDHKDDFIITFDGGIIAVRESLVKPLRDRATKLVIGYEKLSEKFKIDSIENLFLICACYVVESEIASSEESVEDSEEDCQE
jgi:hypothetical protein